MHPDIEYENAIRCYLDNLFSGNVNGESSEEFIDLNVVKPLTGYIAKNAPEGFQFSTPMFAWWDLTSACNFRCIHCLYNDTPYDASRDLTDDEALRLADSLIDDFGIVQVVLSGGEIFLRAELLMKLIKKFKENNIGVAFATNAALINDEHIDFIAENMNRYTDRIQISLDGATFETFKKIRQTDKFDKIVSNIEKLSKKGIRVTVVYTVNKINYDEVVAAYELANNIGAYDFVAGKMLVFNESHEKLLVSEREKMLLVQKLLEAREGKTTSLKLGLFTNISLLNIPEVTKILKEDKYVELLKTFTILPLRSCNRNDRISIRSDGRVYMSMDAECPNGLMGNVREKSLLEIWAERNKNVFFQPRLLENMGCKKCNFKTICNSGCMAKAYKRTGDINTPEIDCKFCSR